MEILLLEVEALRILYGGVVAVEDISFTSPGFGRRPDRSERRRQDTVVDALTGSRPPPSGYGAAEREITGHLHAFARLGMIRTFQSVELFDDLNVEENLAVARRASVDLARVRQVLGTHRSGLKALRWAMSGGRGCEPVAGR